MSITLEIDGYAYIVSSTYVHSVVHTRVHIWAICSRIFTHVGDMFAHVSHMLTHGFTNMFTHLRTGTRYAEVHVVVNLPV